jgi:hypothetical protein
MKKTIVLYLAFMSLMSFANAQWQQTSVDSVYVSSFAIKGNDIFISTVDFVNNDSSGIFLSSTNGDNWTKLNTGFTFPLVFAIAISGNNIFAGTYWGGVYLSSDYGGSWTNVSNGLEAYTSINALAISGNNIYAGGYGMSNYSCAFLSTDNGQLWDSINNGLPIADGNISAFAISGDTIFTGFNSCGVYYSINNGSNWNLTNLVIPDIYSLVINGSDMFAGSDSGRIYLSSNNGSSWDTLNTGNTASVYSLAINGSNIFAGTLGGGISFSSDYGNSWSIVNTGLTNDTIISLAISGSYIFAGTYSGGVLRRPLSELGINEINNNESIFTVYPNPTKDKLTIESLQKSTLEILNLQGQKILQRQLQQEKTDIDISGLAKGIYILRLNNNKKTEVTKILKE